MTYQRHKYNSTNFLLQLSISISLILLMVLGIYNYDLYYIKNFMYDQYNQHPMYELHDQQPIYDQKPTDEKKPTDELLDIDKIIHQKTISEMKIFGNEEIYHSGNIIFGIDNFVIFLNQIYGHLRIQKQEEYIIDEYSNIDYYYRTAVVEDNKLGIAERNKATLGTDDSTSDMEIYLAVLEVIAPERYCSYILLGGFLDYYSNRSIKPVKSMEIMEGNLLGYRSIDIDDISVILNFSDVIIEWIADERYLEQLSSGKEHFITNHKCVYYIADGEKINLLSIGFCIGLEGFLAYYPFDDSIKLCFGSLILENLFINHMYSVFQFIITTESAYFEKLEARFNTTTDHLIFEESIAELFVGIGIILSYLGGESQSFVIVSENSGTDALLLSGVGVTLNVPYQWRDEIFCLGGITSLKFDSYYGIVIFNQNKLCLYIRKTITFGSISKGIIFDSNNSIGDGQLLIEKKLNNFILIIDAIFDEEVGLQSVIDNGRQISKQQRHYGRRDIHVPQQQLQYVHEEKKLVRWFYLLIFMTCILFDMSITKYDFSNGYGDIALLYFGVGLLIDSCGQLRIWDLSTLPMVTMLSIRFRAAEYLSNENICFDDEELESLIGDMIPDKKAEFQLVINAEGEEVTRNNYGRYASEQQRYYGYQDIFINARKPMLQQIQLVNEQRNMKQYGHSYGLDINDENKLEIFLIKNNIMNDKMEFHLFSELIFGWIFAMEDEKRQEENEAGYYFYLLLTFMIWFSIGYGSLYFDEPGLGIENINNYVDVTEELYLCHSYGLEIYETIQKTLVMNGISLVNRFSDKDKEEESEQEIEAAKAETSNNIYDDELLGRIIVGRNYSLSFYVDTARGVFCIEEEVNITGRGDNLLNACKLVETLKRQQIITIKKLLTGMNVEPDFNAYGDAEWSQPTAVISFILIRGELGKFIVDYQQRKFIEIFENNDEKQLGEIAVGKVKLLQMVKKFKANNKQGEEADTFLNENANDNIVLLILFIFPRMCVIFWLIILSFLIWWYIMKLRMNNGIIVGKSFTKYDNKSKGIELAFSIRGAQEIDEQTSPISYSYGLKEIDIINGSILILRVQNSSILNEDELNIGRQSIDDDFDVYLCGTMVDSRYYNEHLSKSYVATLISIYISFWLSGT